MLSQPLRNLPGKVRNPDVRRTSETLRFRYSGLIWQRVWISAGGRGRSGDTGTDGRLALPGNRGLPAKKRKVSFEAGLHDSEWSNVCSMETVERTTMESNASSAIRVLFPDRDERGRIGARTIRFRIHYAPKTKNLTYHWYIRILLLVSFSFKGSPSGKRDSDPRPQPWQGCALKPPKRCAFRGNQLSYSLLRRFSRMCFTMFFALVKRMVKHLRLSTGL